MSFLTSNVALNHFLVPEMSFYVFQLSDKKYLGCVIGDSESICAYEMLCILHVFYFIHHTYISIQFKRYLLSLEIQYGNKTILYR